MLSKACNSTLQCSLVLERRQVLHMNGSINVRDRYIRLALYANNCPNISNVMWLLTYVFGWVVSVTTRAWYLLHTSFSEATCKLFGSSCMWHFSANGIVNPSYIYIKYQFKLDHKVYVNFQRSSHRFIVILQRRKLFQTRTPIRQSMEEQGYQCGTMHTHRERWTHTCPEYYNFHSWIQ
jgi:hypothetical protein